MGIPNKNPLQILTKMERGRIQGLSKFWVPHIISGTGKATDFKFGEYMPIRIKAHKNFWEKEAWAYTGAAQFFCVPPIISGTGKATDFKFCRNIRRVDRNKTPLKIGNSSRGCSQGVPKSLRAPTYRAYCAVIFAIAQLSHEVPHWLYISKFTRLRAVSRRQHGSCPVRS